MPTKWPSRCSALLSKRKIHVSAETGILPVEVFVLDFRLVNKSRLYCGDRTALYSPDNAISYATGHTKQRNNQSALASEFESGEAVSVSPKATVGLNRAMSGCRNGVTSNRARRDKSLQSTAIRAGAVRRVSGVGSPGVRGINATVFDVFAPESRELTRRDTIAAQLRVLGSDLPKRQTDGHWNAGYLSKNNTMCRALEEGAQQASAWLDAFTHAGASVEIVCHAEL